MLVPNNQDTDIYQASDKIKIKFDIDEIEIDDESSLDQISFKPLNRGLGFHHDKKPPARFKSPPNIDIKNSIPETYRNKLSPQSLFVPNSQSFKTVSNPTLYQNSVHHKKKTTAQKKSSKNVPVLLQFAAWLIDVLIVFSLVIFTLGILALVSDIEYKTLISVITFSEIAVFFSSLFSLYYLFYFSILDLSTTVGKSLMGIRLVRIDGRPKKIYNTFTRSFITLVSVILFFLPLLIDFQGRLSDTQISQ